MKSLATWLLTVCLVAFAVMPALGQSVGSYAPVVRTTGITYTPITATGTSLTGTWRNGTSTDDNRSAAQPIGFTFYYNGLGYTTFCVSTNGFMDLSASAANGSGTGAYGYTNASFSNATTSTLLALAPMYDDLVCQGNPGTQAGLDATFKRQVDGVAPNRVLTVQWTSLEVYNNAGPDLNFQVKLYEATGTIEFWYGSMTAGTATYSYTCGINGTTMSSTPTVAELLTQQTANTTTFSNTPSSVLSAVPAASTMLTFTPAQHVTPDSPANLTFSAVTQSSMTVGWTDNSTTETYFNVFRSSDGTNFAQVGTVTSTSTAGTGTAYSLPQSGLVANQTYYFRITANNEGSAPSAFLSGSQTTNPPGSITSVASGNWSNPATWGGSVPGQFDDVTIADGTTVTIDTAALCYNLTVGQGSSGVLQWDTASARTLNAAMSVTIAPGAAFQTGAAGSVATHMFSVGGSLTNNGTLDFVTTGASASSCRAGITFTTAGNATFGGSGAVTDISTITLNKGSGVSSVLELNPSNFTVQGVNTDIAGFLTLTNGTFKISGSFTLTNRIFTTAAYTIGTSSVPAGLWLNNPNFIVAAQAGSPYNYGLLRLSQGTMNVGTATGNILELYTGSSTIIEGGTLNLSGAIQAYLTTSVFTYTQTGGVVNACTVGLASSYACFDMGSSTSSAVTMSGGTVNIVLANTTTTGARDYRNNGGIIYGDCTVNLGTLASGAAKTYGIQGYLPNLVVASTAYPANHSAVLVNTTYARNTTVAAGSLTVNGYRFITYGSTLTNNGTITGTTASSSLYFMGGGSGKTGGSMKSPASEPPFADAVEPDAPLNGAIEKVAQTYTGTGAVTAPLTALEIDNVAGVSLASGLTTARVNLFRGTLNNSYRVTLGNGGATSGVTQIGVASNTLPGGSYDVAPTFNYGSGGYTVLYAQENAGRSTGVEIPPVRSIASMTVNNNNGVTLAGGGLSLTSGLTLTAGLLNTSAANLLTLANSVATPPAGSAASFVNGPLAIEFNVSAATNRAFAVGKGAAFRPVTLKSVNTGGISQVFTCELVNSFCGGTPNPPMISLDPARYWTISNSANLNAAARVNLTYGTDDGVLAQSSARVTQCPTLNGTYMSLGGTATSTTVESTADLTPGSDYFTLGVDNPPITWDGGALTSNWGDAANWNPDGVPTGSQNVSLTAAGALSVNLNGNYPVNSIDLGSNVTLSLTSNTLTVNGGFNQTAGVLDEGTGTLEIVGGFSKSGGTFTANAGTTIFDGGIAGQLIPAGVGFYNLTLRNGGTSGAKTLTAAGTYAVANDLTVESTAQLVLSAATATTLSVGGNLNYAGIGAGANIGNLTLNLTGSGKTINGASLWSRPTALTRSLPKPSEIRTIAVSMVTDPARLTVDLVKGEKVVTGYENTLAQKEGEARKVLQGTDPAARAVVVLDDCTLSRNPADFAGLLVAPTLDLAVTIATGGSYTLGDNLTLASGRILSISGRLNCGTFALGGAGGVSVANGAFLGTGTADPLGLGATVLTSGTNTYTDGCIIEYNAAGDQHVHVAAHPASALLYTAGSGTKTLDANLPLTANSSSAITKAALWVGAGTTFADGGHRLSFTTINYANVNVIGTFLSTGSGSISYESGPYLSTIQAVDGTTFGDVLTNFASSSNALYIAAPGGGTVTMGLRNLVFGGSAGTGTAGGTWKLGYTGQTNLLINGNLSLAPATTSNTGGGFTGYGSGNTATVTLKGNLSSTSTAATQPIYDATGTSNTFVFGGSSAQSLTMPVNATLFSGTPVSLKINNPAGLSLGGSTAHTYTIGGNLNLTTGAISTGIHTLAIGASGTVTRTSGHVIGRLQKSIAAGTAVVQNFEIGTDGDYAPVALSFASVGTPGSVVASTAAGDHAQIAGSGLNPALTANRTWTVTNNGVGFTTCDATLNFVPGDLDPGANPAAFEVRKYDAGTWSSPAVGTRTSTSIQATGVTGFSDFQVGEQQAYTITATAGAGGTINPNGAVVVLQGEDQAFALSPNAGYHIVDVLVDGSSVGAVAGYTFSNVTANHTIAASFAINSYTITASAGSGGGIAPSGPVAVTHGSSQAFAITPEPCHHIADVLVDGSSVGAVAGYTFSNVTANHTIAASFAVDTYTITAGAGTGGTITPSGAVVTGCGGDQAFSLTPDACYEVADVLVDGISVGAVTGYTFSNVTANHTISASFVLKNNVNAGPASGAITLANPTVTVPVTIDRGCATEAVMAFSVKFTVSPILSLPGGLGSITVGGFLDADGGRTIHFQAIDLGGGQYEADGSILGLPCGSSALSGVLFNVVLGSSATDGTGSVTITEVRLRDCANNDLPPTIGTAATVLVDLSAPAVAVTVPNGGEIWHVGSTENITWTGSDLEGLAGFDLAYSTDGGATYPHVIATGLPGTQFSYAWTIPNDPSVTAKVRVTAHDVHGNSAADGSDADFTIRPYLIVVTVGANGSVTPNGSVPVVYGGSQSFAIAGASCYHIADVVVDGTSVGAVAGYTFTNVTSDHTIAASFALDSYTITATAGTGGTITPSGAVVVGCGSDQAFAIAADPGYNLVDVLVDGSSVGVVAGYTFTNVQANHTIEAVFAGQYTITATAGAGGTIAPSGVISVPLNGSQAFAIAADPCYHIADVLVDGSSVGPVTGYTFTGVTANHTIAASFAIDTFTLSTSVVGTGTLLIVPSQPLYDCGTSVQITANAGGGWAFDHWTGDATGSTNPLTVVMSGNKSITAVFKDIAAPTVAVTSPNGGESWTSGTVHAITWTATDNVAVTTVDLAYSTDGGLTYPNAIAVGLANSGSYNWTVPNTETFTARVRATAHDAAGNAGADASNANFTILDPASAVAEALLGAKEFAGVYPNPASGNEVHVIYRLTQRSTVEVGIFSVTGHLVKRMTVSGSAGGVGTLTWNGQDESGKAAPAGIYLVKIHTSNGLDATKRLVLFR